MVGRALEVGPGEFDKVSLAFWIVMESTSRRPGGTYVRTMVMSSLVGRLMAEMLSAEEFNVVTRVVSEAVMVTVTFALEAGDVRRVREEPRKTRNTCGIMSRELSAGPDVVVTVPDDAPTRETISQGAEQAEPFDALQTDGRYCSRGLSFSRVVTCAATK